MSVNPPDNPSPQPQPPHTFVNGYDKSTEERYSARTVASSASYLLAHLDALAQTTPAFRFLDVGCGPGSITVELAARYPQATFVGIDPGAPFIASAQTRARAQNVRNVEFRVASIDDLETLVAEDQWPKFDLVACHQVLNHVADPPRALRRMRAVAAPGTGIVAAREMDMDALIALQPRLPALDDWQRLMQVAGRAKGSDLTAGGKLVRYALEAGWARSEIEASASANGYFQTSEKTVWAGKMCGMLGDADGEWGAAARKAAVGVLEGWGDKESVESRVGEMVEAWGEWARDEGSWMVQVSVEIVCRC